MAKMSNAELLAAITQWQIDRGVKRDQAQKRASEIVLKEQIAGKIDNLPDEAQAELAFLYDEWEAGKDYEVGDIVRQGTEPYRVVQAHSSQPDWTPRANPALFTPVRQTTGANPDPWVQPTGAQDAYAKNARVTHDNPNDAGNIWIYESAIAANTTEPGRDGTFDRYWTPVAPV